MSTSSCITVGCRKFLRRLLSTSGTGVLALSMAACASRSAREAPASSAPSSAIAEPWVEHEYLEQWKPPPGPALELELSPELRSACHPFTELPPRIVFEQSGDVEGELEPLTVCLTLGPLSDRTLHLFGETELPGPPPAPVQAGGRADQVRSALSLTGVPFENIVTHHVAGGALVELAIAASSS